MSLSILPIEMPMELQVRWSSEPLAYVFVFCVQAEAAAAAERAEIHAFDHEDLVEPPRKVRATPAGIYFSHTQIVIRSTGPAL